MLPTFFRPPPDNERSRWTHPKHLVGWGGRSTDEANAILQAIDGAKAESDMQRFLTENPRFLVDHLGGGHGRWVIPQFRLGSHFVIDFVIGEKHSFGHDWQLVELESPLKRMFNKNGDPSATLNHAMRQIGDWRSWLNYNQNLAARELKDDGLGLIDIVAECSGLILLGRRGDLSDSDNVRRRQMMRQSKIQIRTYDFLLESGGLPMSHHQWPDIGHG